MKSIFTGVYLLDNKLATLNAVPGKQVYNEHLIKREGKEFRLWDPFRSKLAAAVKKSLKTFPFVAGSKVLYLGASTGTTVSHLSDIIGNGEIFAIEISAHVMKSLLRLADQRNNIIPILADANKPREYRDVGQVDVLYQDVAQANQSEILIKNAQQFLKPEGIAMLAIKSQSIDVTKKPSEVFEQELRKLSEFFEVLETFELEPFDKDHLFVVLKKL
ncbi:fibrillarin-like rRNA/tRNA 2'-O-methyltransferase [Candidatus Micrarchaeota archaeon]|nr:fibrillarin-like rRNA/tRNA 2'-O-methyltransferase [Candidatus Micrarchaeota archaeon]